MFLAASVNTAMVGTTNPDPRAQHLELGYYNKATHGFSRLPSDQLIVPKNKTMQQYFTLKSAFCPNARGENVLGVNSRPTLAHDMTLAQRYSNVELAYSSVIIILVLAFALLENRI